MLSLIALAASSVQLLGGRAGVLVFDSKIALRPIQPGTMLRSSAIRGWGDDAVLRDGTFRKCCVSDSLTHWKRLGWRQWTEAGAWCGYARYRRARVTYQSDRPRAVDIERRVPSL